MNKQPQTCYVADKHGEFRIMYAYGKSNPQPVKAVTSVYIHTPEELEALKAEWQREAAEKMWYYAESEFGYANTDFRHVQQYLDQHYPLPQHLNTNQ